MRLKVPMLKYSQTKVKHVCKVRQEIVLVTINCTNYVMYVATTCSHKSWNSHFGTFLEVGTILLRHLVLLNTNQTTPCWKGRVKACHYVWHKVWSFLHGLLQHGDILWVILLCVERTTFHGCASSKGIPNDIAHMFGPCCTRVENSQVTNVDGCA